jgi:hypothetical protein
MYSGPLYKANRPFKVYLATGSSVRLTVARPWIDRLIARGFHVVDWTRDSNWDLDRMPTEAEFVESATRDEDAIMGCDLFWYLVAPDKSEGAASELMLAAHARDNSQAGQRLSDAAAVEKLLGISETTRPRHLLHKPPNQ